MNPEKCQIWTWRFARCMFIIEKNSWTKDEGNLDSPSISVIYYRTWFISVASANRVCSLTHAKGKKKTLARFIPTHLPQTPLQLCTVSLTAIGGGLRSRSKQYRISPLPLSAAYLHRHSRLWSTGVFCGIGPGIFLMEKVINLLSETFTHLLS